MEEKYMSIFNGCKCEGCGETAEMYLGLHHLDGSGNERHITGMIGDISMNEKLCEELANSVLVCDDCHNLIHEIGIDSVIGDISIYQNTIHL